MTVKQKKLIRDMVQDDFECGHSYKPEDKNCLIRDLLVEKDAEDRKAATEMANYYYELHELGPVGIMDEIPRGWSDDYKSEYGQN